MPISSDGFVPRPGIVNKKGCLPEARELVCIQVPKVFDQCLIKRCLEYAPGPDTSATDMELRSNPISLPPGVIPRMFSGCRNFNLTIESIERFPLPKNPSYKKLVVSFIISFTADYIDSAGNIQSELYDIHRTETISKLYCPDPIAKVVINTPTSPSQNVDSQDIKLEMVAKCLDGKFTKVDDTACFYLDVTLGFYIIVKYELMVQLLIPAYGYCPVPDECKDEPEEDPCVKFQMAPVPKFFPNQHLRPLFDDDDNSSDDNSSDDNSPD